MSIVACLDGLNLALSTGSGIATYGRNLLQAVEAGGMRTQILFGPRGRVGEDPLTDEIALVDGTRAAAAPSKIDRHLLTFRAPIGLKATAVRRTQTVIWPNDGPPAVRADDYWISQDIFRSAARSFRRTRKLTKVEFRADRDVPTPDVMHWTSPVPIRARGAVNIYTIHDLIPLRLPTSTLDTKQDYLKAIKATCEVADQIIVVSETTMSDLIDLIGVDPGKITNTYQSVFFDMTDRTDAEVATFLSQAFGLEWKNYFLHYGTIEPKKNLARTVEAYLRSGVDTPLVLAGATGWLDKPETALLRAVMQGGEAAKRIWQYEYLPADILRDLVRGAKATLFPSIYEGFGLPVIESMFAGTPVITSNAGSLPEIAGGAAALVDPMSVTSIAAAIADLDGDDLRRTELSALGREHAKVFAPELYQDRLAAVYVKLGLA